MLSWADSLERARQQWSRPKSTHLHIDSSSCNMASALTAHVSSRVTPSPAVQPAVSAVAHPPATPLQESVLASVTYTQPRPDGEQLFTSVARPSSGQQANNLVPDPKIVKINDIRTSQRRFSLQSNGFQLEPLPLDAAIDWDSSDEVGFPTDSLLLPATPSLHRECFAEEVFLLPYLLQINNRNEQHFGCCCRAMITARYMRAGASPLLPRS